MGYLEDREIQHWHKQNLVAYQESNDSLDPLLTLFSLYLHYTPPKRQNRSHYYEREVTCWKVLSIWMKCFCNSELGSWSRNLLHWKQSNKTLKQTKHIYTNFWLWNYLIFVDGMLFSCPGLKLRNSNQDIDESGIETGQLLRSLQCFSEILTGLACVVLSIR